MARRKLEIVLAGDERDLDRSLGSAEGRLGGFGSKLGGFAVGAASAMAAAFAVDKIRDFGTEMFNLGTSLEVMDGKVSVVFEGQADAIREWADANNEAMGMGEGALAGLAAGFGDLLKPMGFSAEQASAMSQEVVGLSGALSAWTGNQKSAAEVTEILQSAMLGETEGLKGLGISISQADVAARLAANGQSELTGAAREQAEALAVQALIFEKSTDAQTAWNDGTMDGIKNQNELSATFADVKETIANGLLPVFQGAIKFLTDEVIPGVKDVIAIFQSDGLGGVLDEAGSRLQAAWPSIEKAVVDIGTKLVEWVKTQGPVIARQVVEWSSAFLEWILPIIPPMLEKLGHLLSDIGAWVIDEGLPMLHGYLIEWGHAFAGWLGENFLPYLGQLWDLLYALGDWIITDALPFIAAELAEWGQAFVDWIGPQIGPALEELWRLLGVLKDWIMDEGLPALAIQLDKWGEAFLDWLKPVLASIPGKLWDLALVIGEWIVTEASPWLIEKGIDLQNAILDWIGDAARAAPGKLYDFGVVVINWFSTLPGKIVTALGDLAGLLLDKGGDLLGGLWDGIVGMWPNFLAGLGIIVDRIKGFFTGAIDWLFEVGKDILEGLWEGMKDVWEDISGWLDDITGLIPFKKGPPERDRTLLTENGRLIMAGFRDGLEAGWAEMVEPSLAGMTTSIPGVTGSSGSSGSSGTSSTRSSRTLPSTLTVQLVLPDGRVLAEELVPHLRVLQTEDGED